MYSTSGHIRHVRSGDHHGASDLRGHTMSGQHDDTSDHQGHGHDPGSKTRRKKIPPPVRTSEAIRAKGTEGTVPPNTNAKTGAPRHKPTGQIRPTGITTGLGHV